jgi:hypothetical protein
MKFFTCFTILAISVSVCFAQTKRSMHFTHPPLERNLLILMEDSVAIDTLLEGPGGFKLVDYFIKSDDQISIIVNDEEQYLYYQFHKSKIYPLWTFDSLAQWSKPGYHASLKNPNNPDRRAMFELKDFHTVIKIVDDTSIGMNLQAEKSEHAQPPMHERELRYVIDLFSEDPQKDWRDIDSVFRNHIVLTPSISLREFAFLMLVRKKEFLEKSDVITLEYYAQQFELMEYHYNIKFYIMFMNKLSSFWPPERTAQYARNFYEKNTTYWETKYSSPYWEDRKTELKELRLLMRQ